MNAFVKVLLSLVLLIPPMFVKSCDFDRPVYRRVNSMDTESSLALTALRSESSSTVGKHGRTILDLRFGEVNRTNPYELNLSKKGLGDLTGLEQISKLDNVCKANFSGNELPNISLPLGQLIPRATEFNFSRNEITFVNPAAFSDLDSLRFVDLSRNKLRVFGALGGLRNLIGVDLSHNELNTMEAGAFDDNIRLRTLNLSHNQINSLTARLFDRQGRLKTLLLNHNQLKKFPDGFFDGLVELRDMAIDHNKIPGTPREFIQKHFAGRAKPVTHVAFKKVNTYAIEELQRGLFVVLQPYSTQEGRIALLQEREFATAEGLEKIAQGMLVTCHDDARERRKEEFVCTMKEWLGSEKEHVVLEYEALSECMPLLCQIQTLKQQKASLPLPITNAGITSRVGDNVLHFAATCKMPLVLNALLQVFPQYLRAKNREGAGVLGLAADSMHANTMFILFKRFINSSFCSQQALEEFIRHIVVKTVAKEGFVDQETAAARRELLWKLTQYAHERERAERR